MPNVIWLLYEEIGDKLKRPACKVLNKSIGYKNKYSCKDVQKLSKIIILTMFNNSLLSYTCH